MSELLCAHLIFCKRAHCLLISDIIWRAAQNVCWCAQKYLARNRSDRHFTDMAIATRSKNAQQQAKQKSGTREQGTVKQLDQLKKARYIVREESSKGDGISVH